MRAYKKNTEEKKHKKNTEEKKQLKKILQLHIT